MEKHYKPIIADEGRNVKMFQQINAIFGRAFIEQDNARLEPQGLTVRQERKAELYARLVVLEADQAIIEEEKAELLDELRNMGEAV